MIYSLTGKILHTSLDLCVIECGGVGYACKTTMTTLQQIAGRDSATLYTYMSVREDAIDLFGFAAGEELECFKLLTSVSGVGAKYALSILSNMTSDKVALAIASQDSAAFTKIKGVGNKIAQRIVMELKDKIAGEYAYIGEKSGVSLDAVSSSAEAANPSEAIAALVVLGYSQSEAATAIASLDASLPVDELIRRGLKLLSSKKF